MQEIEVKYMNIDKEKTRKKLEELGFIKIHPERMLKRKTFHFTTEKERKRWVRVRDEGEKITMTFKEIVKDNDINSVLENELIIDSFEKGYEFLKSLDLIEVSYQETMREEWLHNKDKVSICIDTWPLLNPILEIEADNDTLVKEYSKKLGFDFEKDGMFGGISGAYNKMYGVPEDVINNDMPIINFAMKIEDLIK